MSNGLGSTKEDIYLIEGICINCWCTFLFHNEGYHDMDTLSIHPQLTRRLGELYPVVADQDGVCILCSASKVKCTTTIASNKHSCVEKDTPLVVVDNEVPLVAEEHEKIPLADNNTGTESTLDGTYLIANDIHFVPNDGILSVDIDGCPLEDIFYNVGMTSGADAPPGVCVLSSDFNLSVLAVFFHRNIGRNPRINSWAKQSIKIELSQHAKQHFERCRQVLVRVGSDIMAKIMAIENPSDEVTQLMQAYSRFANRKGVSNSTQDVSLITIELYIRRLRNIVLHIVQAECKRLESSSNPLFNRLIKVYEEDRPLFEQLLRIDIETTVEFTTRVKITKFEVSRHVITFKGYYNKFARGICQTSWTPDKDTKSAMSVEDCLIVLLEICKGTSYKFMASGREDYDVRTIGSGRKFCVEVYNCKRDLFDIFMLIEQVTSREFDKVNSGLPLLHLDITQLKQETTVNVEGDHKFYLLNSQQDKEEPGDKEIAIVPVNSETLSQAFSDGDTHQCPDAPVAVGFYGLKVVFDSKLERQIVQYDAENKNKTYSCLVFSEVPIDLDKLKALPTGPFVILQSNPLRTSHRKSQCERQREIHQMSVDPLHPRLFHLKLKTQAGTYIKEFVTGDLDRTTPSVKSLLGAQSLYVIHLDVVDFS
ncbi:tRNA pseudouridine(54-55) synthase, putative [Babesia ovis]|uniref:tRNA pseudouridine(55) synthase n=1 Tax=Babesia ovis TaxID=5869 RepID=A0A9W5WW80_BABOV|nr:tRNA pseudouridine(54-55) synthase, putative [Babesia ovis]